MDIQFTINPADRLSTLPSELLDQIFEGCASWPEETICVPLSRRLLPYYLRAKFTRVHFDESLTVGRFVDVFNARPAIRETMRELSIRQGAVGGGMEDVTAILLSLSPLPNVSTLSLSLFYDIDLDSEEVDDYLTPEDLNFGYSHSPHWFLTGLIRRALPSVENLHLEVKPLHESDSITSFSLAPIHDLPFRSITVALRRFDHLADSAAFQDAALEVLFRGADFPRVESLTVTGFGIADRAVAANLLGSCQRLPRLRHLYFEELAHDPHPQAVLKTLDRSLESLCIRGHEADFTFSDLPTKVDHLLPSMRAASTLTRLALSTFSFENSTLIENLAKLPALEIFEVDGYSNTLPNDLLLGLLDLPHLRRLDLQLYWPIPGEEARGRAVMRQLLEKAKAKGIEVRGHALEQLRKAGLLEW
ncbi:hypothetical protein JCM10207_008459 [Rhodosporidiobolus poonsookiae]